MVARRTLQREKTGIAPVPLNNGRVGKERYTEPAPTKSKS